jgi:hypothetical protein
MRHRFKLAALCFAISTALWSQDQSLPVTVKPGDDLQQLVDTNPEGTTFVFERGLYRLARIVPKNGDSFFAWQGAELNGSWLLADYFPYGRLWAYPYLPQHGPERGLCTAARPQCKYSEDLFFDDQPLVRAASIEETGPGQWFFDYADQKVYLGSNPEGHKVELGTRSFAFRGAASNVTISGFLIEKYAVPAQSAAVDALGPGWNVQANEIRLNHGWGVRIADGMVLARNYIHSNGQLGIGGTARDALVEGNEIALNNYAGFEPGWEAGGAKFFNSTNLRIRGNAVCRNFGTGLWTDTENLSVFFEDNTITENMGPGIQHEISFNALIARNVLRGNALGGSPWLWGAQILIQNSRDVEVTGNQVEVNADVGNGISIIQQDRGPYPAIHNWVHHNDITYLGPRGQSGAVADFDSPGMFAGNNRFDFNSYHSPDSDVAHWAWQDDNRTWTAFRRLGQEVNGTLNVPAAAPAALGSQASGIVAGLGTDTAIAGSPSVCAK